MLDTDNIPVLYLFVLTRQRAFANGIMNLAGVFAGALITRWPGKSIDAGVPGRDLAFLSIPVADAVNLLFTILKPVTADKTSD